MTAGAVGLVALVTLPWIGTVATAAFESKRAWQVSAAVLLAEWLALIFAWEGSAPVQLGWSAELGINLSLALDGFAGAGVAGILGVSTIVFVMGAGPMGGTGAGASWTTRASLHACRGGVALAALSSNALVMLAGVSVYMLALAFAIAGDNRRAAASYAVVAALVSAMMWFALLVGGVTQVQATGGAFSFELRLLSSVVVPGPTQYWQLGSLLVAVALVSALPGLHTAQARIAEKAPVEIGVSVVATGPVVGLLIASKAVVSAGPLALGELGPSLAIVALSAASVLLLAAFTTTRKRGFANATSVLAATWFAVFCTAGPGSLAGIWLWALPASTGLALSMILRASPETKNTRLARAPLWVVCVAAPGVALVGTLILAPALSQPTAFLAPGISLVWVVALQLGAMGSLLFGARGFEAHEASGLRAQVLVGGLVAVSIGLGLWPGKLVAPLHAAATQAASVHRRAWCASLPIRYEGRPEPIPQRGPCAADETAAVVLFRAYGVRR